MRDVYKTKPKANKALLVYTLVYSGLVSFRNAIVIWILNGGKSCEKMHTEDLENLIVGIWKASWLYAQDLVV
jgi:hypothetical protein